MWHKGEGNEEPKAAAINLIKFREKIKPLFIIMQSSKREHILSFPAQERRCSEIVGLFFEHWYRQHLCCELAYCYWPHINLIPISSYLGKLVLWYNIILFANDVKKMLSSHALHDPDAGLQLVLHLNNVSNLKQSQDIRSFLIDN